MRSNPRRRLSPSQERTLRGYAKEARDALSSHPTSRSGLAQSTFTAKRSVIDGALHSEEAQDWISQQSGRMGNNSSFIHSVTLLRSVDAKNIYEYTGESCGKLRERVDEIITMFPRALEGRLGGVGIFGAQRGKSGQRYVAMTFDCSQAGLGGTIMNEKNTIFSELGVENVIRPSRAHLSVYQTLDQRDAERTAESLKMLQLGGKLIELGAPATHAVMWRS